MTITLPKTFEPREHHQRIIERWLDSDAFGAVPDSTKAPDERYVIMMPLPNVTGALHMGHAIDNVMQDLLIRWHRMMGHSVLWQPGTDHAGIATQAVVEKRLFELEGKTRHDIGRDELIKRIWEWKDEYQQRIIHQQQQMGCSCDWKRQRFTMDEVCSAAVRESFFRLFTDRLIYRGDRLVNWDCHLQTAVSDDEVYHETVAGHFWHLRYPVVDPRPGEPPYIVVATTRPETMLGDTAVACHPDPKGALQKCIAEQKDKLAKASVKDRPAAEAALEQLRERMQTGLKSLELLTSMARGGRRVQLPLQGREIPLIVDEWAKPELGSGCVKITPAHDLNDYEVWTRHRDEIEIVNILNPDGSLNQNAGAYKDMDRFKARERVLQDLRDQGLLGDIEDRNVEIGHSDRSKTPVEPYLSRQWFVRMGDLAEGIVCARGTLKEFKTSGLAQAAIDAATAEPGNHPHLGLRFHPDRYRATYINWLAEKRDWCISRQLWWGHRIPVWTASAENEQELRDIVDNLPKDADQHLTARIVDSKGTPHSPKSVCSPLSGPFSVEVCLRNKNADEMYSAQLKKAGLTQSEDVLDTWFSSSLWPFSTLGWPDPENASIQLGQRPLGATDDQPDSFSYYYPGSCLVTARDIITLWVARMLVMGLYNNGDVPFTDCFVHAKILDGNGVTMSKSKGNGIDPVDIIESYGTDAMRYLLCDMETGMQDVRLPVQANCPSCSKLVELTDAKHGRTMFSYLCPQCKTEFDVLGTMPDLPSATVFSDRFEAGRNFCNKLWNAARFVLMNLGEIEFNPIAAEQLADEDRWILSRLNHAISDVSEHLAAYSPSAALSTARNFFWNELCDWYLELIKPRLRDQIKAIVARQVLALCLDQVLRLLHPFVPFITEALWEYLNGQAPIRGIEEAIPVTDMCIHARWPQSDRARRDEALEGEFFTIQTAVRRMRELRSRHDVPPRKLLPAAIKTSGKTLQILKARCHLITDLTRVEKIELGQEITIPKNAATQVDEEMEIFLGDILDPEKERARLEKQISKLSQQLQASQKKLADDNFIKRAPTQVVQTEHKRATELQAQIAILERNLKALQLS